MEIRTAWVDWKHCASNDGSYCPRIKGEVLLGPSIARVGANIQSCEVM